MILTSDQITKGGFSVCVKILHPGKEIDGEIRRFYATNSFLSTEPDS